MGSSLKDPRGTCLLPCRRIWQIHSFLLRRQALLKQFERDDNVLTLLKAIRDAFDFAKEASVLRNIKQASAQAEILDEMLRCVSEIVEFIESYAKDVQVGTSS